MFSKDMPTCKRQTNMATSPKIMFHITTARPLTFGKWILEGKRNLN
jgi:hypothetical protein